MEVLQVNRAAWWAALVCGFEFENTHWVMITVFALRGSDLTPSLSGAERGKVLVFGG
jgi:hypothetical protein